MPSPPNETLQAIRDAGGQAVALVGSVTDADFGERFVQLAVDTYGGLDIIVNNAGYTWDNVIQKMSDEQWDAILDVHLKAPFRILRAAQPVISALAKKEAAEGGASCRKVVNISSIAGLGGNAGQVELLRGEGRHRRPHEDAGQGVGPLQRDGQRGRVRLHQDATHRHRRRRPHRRRRQRDQGRHERGARRDDRAA